MSSQGHDCPFVNRSDPRCSSYFSLDRLRHAFQYCLGDYHTCPLYAELLVERRLKRVAAANREARAELSHAEPTPVQVTIARPVQQPFISAA